MRMSNPDQTKLDLADVPTNNNVAEYRFEPIKGYPLLSWRGKRPFTSTRYYPAQLKEVHGNDVDGWRNKIYWGDNLQVLSHLLKSFRGKVQLIYIDPPFDSKADYKRFVRLKGQSIQNDYGSFEEKQYTDIWLNDDYLQFMYERLIVARELLADTGSIYLHCDWHKGHLLRCVLDEVFGPENFRNEIIWKRSSIATNVSTQWRNSHDTLFFYSKTTNYKFFVQYGAPSESTMDHYAYEDENGKYQLVPLLGSGKSSGETGKTWRGINPNLIGVSGMHWLKSPSTLEQLDKEGKIYWPEKEDGRPRLKFYLSESKGVYIPDLWDDIYIINAMARESLGYPTQKPETLMERIVRSSSESNDIVMDFFMGSGTTQSVAMKTGRRFIGADINLGAVQITTKRLLGTAEELSLGNQQGNLFAEEDDKSKTYYTGFEVYNVNHYDVFRNPIEARELLLEALEVNKLQKSHLFDGEKDGRMVKIMPVNRIATRADLGDLIAGLDLKAFEKRHMRNPNEPVEKITLVCMGHEPNLKASLMKEVEPYKLDVEVVDILRDRQDLQFKRDSEAKITIKNGDLVIERFFPMNLLSKLSLQKEKASNWCELVESVMIDWNYDGAVFTPTTVDIPEKNEMVSGSYPVPKDAGTIRVKITDLLSESLEVEIVNG
jgi:adenine-specific DNA-methyltransferase